MQLLTLLPLIECLICGKHFFFQKLEDGVKSARGGGHLSSILTYRCSALGIKEGRPGRAREGGVQEVRSEKGPGALIPSHKDLSGLPAFLATSAAGGPRA